MCTWIETKQVIDGEEVVFRSIPEGCHLEVIWLPVEPEDGPNTVCRGRMILVPNDIENVAL